MIFAGSISTRATIIPASIAPLIAASTSDFVNAPAVRIREDTRAGARPPGGSSPWRDLKTGRCFRACPAEIVKSWSRHGPWRKGSELSRFCQRKRWITLDSLGMRGRRFLAAAPHLPASVSPHQSGVPSALQGFSNFWDEAAARAGIPAWERSRAGAR